VVNFKVKQNRKLSRPDVNAVTVSYPVSAGPGDVWVGRFPIDLVRRNNCNSRGTKIRVKEYLVHCTKGRENPDSGVLREIRAAPGATLTGSDATIADFLRAGY